jgi:hypothetical protein
MLQIVCSTSPPYGMRKNLDPAVEGVDAETDNPWIPGRGGTQGDPLSTLGWVAFFDILLKALNVVQVKCPFYIRHSGSMLLPQRATCYADDTHGISPCREATDLSNCISSAFAGMFGIAFYPEKLQAITAAKVPGVMTLYDWNWTPITKVFGGVKAYITSLGVSYNLRGDTAELFDALRATLEGVAGILSRREASTMARTLSQGGERKQLIEATGLRCPGSTCLIRVRAVRKFTWLSQTCSAREGALAELRVFAEFSRRSPL